MNRLLLLAHWDAAAEVKPRSHAHLGRCARTAAASSIPFVEIAWRVSA